MRFGTVPVADAAGAVLAHTLRLPDRVIKKGTVLGGEDLAALTRAGYASVEAARLGPDDVGEDEAAHRVARAVAGPGVRVGEPFTGRCNLYAEDRGLALVRAEAVHALNAVHESVTLATLAPHAAVEVGDLVATAKIIPFAVPRARLDACLEAAAGEAPLRVAPFLPHRLGLVLTVLPGTAEKVLGRAEDTMRRRVAGMGSVLERVERVGHDEAEVADALERMLRAGLSPLLVLGASAVVDRGDVIPRAVEAVGGEVLHFGLPVDPGNLLLLARRGSTPVVGVPGCARSLRPSGFDPVLQRLLVGLQVRTRDLQAMGVGGLLKEIASRPHPRTGRVASPGPPRIGAVVLAAGGSSRMEGANKLLETVDGVPLVARVVDALLESPVRPVLVVTGHDREAVEDALGGRGVRIVHNPGWSEGMGTSLAAGVRGLRGGPEPVDAVVVTLGDMPRVRPEDVALLIRSFDPEAGWSICVPVHGHKRGHPVLFAARYFRELAELTGDAGAREVLVRHADEVVEVPLEHPGVLLDVDTREALDDLRRSEEALWTAEEE